MPIKKQLSEYLSKALDIKIDPKSFIEPERIEFGDVSLPCFLFAKKFKKSPQEIAEQFVETIKKNIEQKNSSIVVDAKAVKGYLNLYLNADFLNKQIIRSVLELEKIKKKKQKLMIEYSQPNTHKDFHVGHLRNACLGQSIVNILRQQGHDVIAATYVNDFGSHVAKSLWGYLNKKSSFAKATEDKGKYLGEIYAYATQQAEKDPKVKAEILEIFKKLEAKDKDTIKIWKKTKKWSLQNFEEIYKILGIEFDKVFYESDYFDEGKKLVNDLLEKGILKKSQGAIIADLQEYKLGVLVFITQEGTSLYSVKDIPLALEKFKKSKIDKSIYLVDIRQNLYFKQLFKVLELMGQNLDLMHLDYEFVTLPEGAMASRTGTVVSFYDLYNQVMEYSVAETKKRHQDWDEKQIKKTARMIALTAIKYDMLKTDMKKVIVFDIKKSMQFSGNTGPYLLYSNVRAKSILNKIKKASLKKTDLSLLNSKEEKILLKDLNNFSQVLTETAQQYKPSILAQYLFELANDFNTFYHKHKVLQEENSQIQQARVCLILAINKVFETGFEILGLQKVNKM